jgi:hypothetical protein
MFAGLTAAILAGVEIARHHRAARERQRQAPRHRHERDQADDQRPVDRDALGAQLGLGGFDDFCFFLEQQHDGALNRYDVQRLVRCVQNQDGS